MTYTSSHFTGGTVMNDPFSSLRPQFQLQDRGPASKNFDSALTCSRYVDELRSFNVNDYLPCPKDKLDVKLNFSYGDEFKNYLGRDPQSLGRESSGYSPRSYQPTTSMINLNTSYKDSCPAAPVPVQRAMSTIDGRDQAPPKKPKTAPAKNGKTPDLNNNFFKDARGKFGPIPVHERWADCQVHNRLEELAKPKQLPCEYRDNRRSVYWMTKRPPAKEEGCNHTHFETSCRLDELAIPKVICGEFCGERHCCWECEYPQPPVSCIDPRSVDWNRLACPKRKYPPNGVEIQPVRRAALRALPTKRVCKLSEPKKVIDSDKYYLWLWGKKPDDAVILKKIRRLSIDKCDLSEIRVMLRLELSCTATEESCRKLKSTIPTIKFALEKGAQSVVIICANGNTNGKTEPEFSLQPLTEIFEKHLGHPVIYLEDCVGYQARSLCADPEPGSVFLLENLSFHREEKGKFVDVEGKEEICKPEEIVKFCETLFGLSDVYIVDAITEVVDMSNTTVGIKNQEKAYGFIIKSELQNYNSFVVNPVQPMVAIIGGPFKEKIKILRNLMGKAKEIILGGELAMIFLKAIKKIDIGNIEFTPKMLKKALKNYSRAKDTKTVLYLPSDVVVRNVNTGNYYTVLTRDDIDEDYEVVDIGPFTRHCYTNVIAGAKTLVWSGQMGELLDGTGVISEAFAEATRNEARTYITDEQTKDVFYCCGQRDVTHITLNGQLTTLLLNGKLPKGLSVLNKYRKKIKKHLPIPVIPSNKPTVYELPDMVIDIGTRIKCINDVPIEDKRVVIRVDFDVPNTKSSMVINDYRVRMTIPTIKYAMRNRARSVVIMAHCGSPKGKKVPELTLKPICEALATLLGQTVLFIPETVGKPVQTVLNQIHPGTVVMVENLRFNQGETGEGFTTNFMRASEPMAATPQIFAQYCEGLSDLGDVYVDDAFACLHLDHSSMTGYLGNTKVCGFLVKNEIKYMTKVFNNVKRRFLAIVGGLCSKEKLLMILDLMKEADDIIFAGNLASMFLKVDLGMGLGRNSYDQNLEEIARAIIDLAPYYKCKLHYPVDLWIANSEDGSNPQLHSITKPIPDGMTAVDVGDLTASMFSRIVRKSNIILWTGTVGATKPIEFIKGSKKLLDTIKEVASDPDKRVVSIVCGKSCSEFLQQYNPSYEGITHMSTGGACVVKLLTDRKLLALDVLNYKPVGRLTNILSADSGEYTEQRVLIKVDLNFDLDEDGKVPEPFPLRQLIPLIKMLQRKGARAITLIGYRGAANGVPDEMFSLLPLKEALETVLDQPVVFIPEGVSDAADVTIRSQEPGRVLLLENIRFHPEEIGVKELPGGLKIKVSYDALNDFRNKLSSLGDIFINESFGTVYEADSSNIGMKHKMKLAGLSLKKEVLKYMELRENLEGPVIAVVGGEATAENVSRIYNMLHYVDELILCGGVANTYFASEDTVKMGQTSVNRDSFKYFPKIIKKAKVCGIPIHLPEDFVVAETLLPPPPPAVEEEEGKEEQSPENLHKIDVVTTAQGVPKTSHAFDIGPATVQAFSLVIAKAKTIIYVGDAGAYNYEPFSQGTKALLANIQTATNNGNPTIALGMSTGVMIGQLNALDTFTYYSTGVETFNAIMMNRPLPGMAVLSAVTDKKLKKLRVDQMDLKGKRVLLRLDLDVPTVEGVVLDTDKLEDALQTIKYILKQGAKSLILLGHRGEPNGYKNYYLKMEPLVEELNQLLEMKVTYIHRPCSTKAKNLLADPEPGSVFLMENLKFYPAEYGRDAEPKEGTAPKEELDETQTKDPQTKDPQTREPSALPSVQQITSTEAAAEETEEEADESDDAILSVSDGDGGRNIDAVMFQRMALKTVEEYRTEIAACADAYVSDDVRDVEQALTSLDGFGLEERGAGYLLIKYLMEADESVYNFPGLVNLSPAPA